MAEAKLEVKIGAISFSGEGTEQWLSEQLKTILAEAPKLAALKPPAQEEERDDESEGRHGGGGATFTQSLASYLKAKQAEGNQVKRFLATADWLRQKGTTSLSTKLVSKALKANHQAKLTNAADCLNQNAGKGLVEKDGGGFYITPEGLKSLGHDS